MLPVEALPFDFLLPFQAVRWPETPCSPGSPPSDSSSDSDLENGREPTEHMFMHEAPVWLRDKWKKASCVAAQHLHGTSIAVVGFQDGSIDIYSSSCFDHAQDAPQSPPLLNFPSTSLLPSIKPVQRARLSSNASFSSLRSLGAVSQRNHSASHRRTSRAGLAGKATATLSVSGVEAFASQPPEPTSLLSALGVHHDHHRDDFILSQTAIRSREDLEQSLSPDPSTDTEDEPPSDTLESPLVYHATSQLDCHAFKKVVQTAIIDWQEWSDVKVARTKAALALTQGGILYKVSLKDGRARRLHNFGLAKSQSAGFCLAYSRGHVYVVVYGYGALQLFDVDERKVVSECEVAEVEEIAASTLLLFIRAKSKVIFTLGILEGDDHPSFGLLNAQPISCLAMSLDSTARLLYLLLDNHRLSVANLQPDGLDVTSMKEVRIAPGPCDIKTLDGHALLFYDDCVRLYDSALEIVSTTDSTSTSTFYTMFDRTGQALLSLCDHQICLTSLREDRPYVVTLAKRSFPASSNATASICLNSNWLLVGFESGHVCMAPPNDLLTESTTNISWFQAFQGSSVVFIKEFRHVFLLGAQDGRVAMVDENLQEKCRWNVFTGPLLFADFVTLDNQEYIMFVAQDGAAALSSFRNGPVYASIPVLYLLLTLGDSVKLFVPASTSPAKSVHISWPSLVVCYASGKARVFDIPSGEFRRAITEQVALAELSAAWLSFDIIDRSRSRCVNFDIRTVIQRVSKTQTPSKDALDMVKLILAYLFPFGLSKTVDALIRELGVLVSHSCPTMALPSSSGLAFFYNILPTAPFKISRHASSYHILAIVILTRLFLHVPTLERPASELIVYFTTFLPQRVGSQFQKPTLGLVADYWHDRDAVISESAKVLFGATVSTLSKEEVLAEAQRWHSLLPFADNVVALSSTESKALLIVGMLCAEHHAELPLVMLKDMSMLVVNLLAASQQIVPLKIALELCDRCFDLIQEFCDPVGMFHSLVSLTSDNPQAVAIRPLVTRALGSVAGYNPQLFMTALSSDVLQTKSVEHRIAIFKLVVHLVRRKPVVFFPCLSQIVEAVVRSLDPHDADLRAAIQGPATSTLGELVRTYPAVDFHRATQKLAVGAADGACVMFFKYDLKTATRMYVLSTPGVMKPCIAVSFSPDGRRLVTLSLENRNVSVWKVGTSLLGLVAWGKVPRQHGVQSTSDEGPFRTFDISLTQENSDLQLSEILNQVSIEWLGNRSVRLHIREAVFTFSL